MRFHLVSGHFFGLKIVFPGPLAQHAQVQRANGPHPHGAVAMVHQIVVTNGVNEHHQPLAMHRQPGDHLAKQRWLERQLAAPVRVRTHGFLMYTAHFQREGPGGGFAQRPCLCQGLPVEIHVGVKAVDAGCAGS